MNELPKAVSDFMTEIESLDVRTVEYYFDDYTNEFEEYEYLNPQKDPNLSYWRVVKVLDLKHYCQRLSDYEKQIRVLFNNALKVSVFLLDHEKKGILQILERKNEMYKLFWKWYMEQHKLYRENNFDVEWFKYHLDGFFTSNLKVNESTSLSPTFMNELHDAIMFKHGALKKFINQVQESLPPATPPGVEGKKAEVVCKEPSTKQKKALDLMVNHLKSGQVITNTFFLISQNKGSYSERHLLNIYNKVKDGSLKHPVLRKFLLSDNLDITT